MLRLLSVRNFVVVETLDIEFEPGLTVLTGETGAGKSILIEALGLLLGDRFELAQLRPGAARAELAAEFDVAGAPTVSAFLIEHALPADDDAVLLRRVLDADGRSRAWVNGRPATLTQLKALGERLVDIHGQHAHQALSAPQAQRELIDAYGGFTTLAQSVGDCWRDWRIACERRDAAAQASAAVADESRLLEAQLSELSALAMTADEWEAISANQSRLAHAADLIAASTEAVAALADADDALTVRLARITSRLATAAAHDPALSAIVAMLEPAGVELDEAARALRDYQRRLDLDPAELRRVEERLAAIHDLARKHRVRPETLPELHAATQARLAILAGAADGQALARIADDAEAAYRAQAAQLAAKRRFAGNELANRVTETMNALAMSGGRMEVAHEPVAAAASYGLETPELRVSAHPQQPVGPLARVASGGELSRIALAVQVATSEVGAVPTLAFDEVDSGIGGAVAATVGELLQKLASRRQVLCVTHLPQVAAFADAHLQVSKHGDGDRVTSALTRLDGAERVEEIARMLGGTTITAKTRAHAKEMLDASRRRAGGATR